MYSDCKLLNNRVIPCCLLLFIIMLCINLNAKADMPVTREWCANFIMSYSTIDCNDTDTSVLNSFNDFEEVMTGVEKEISAAVEYGVLKGYEDKTLRLKNNITRAEFACMLYRVKDYYNPPVKQLSYEGNYSDLSDWNEKEIIYCVENGFLIGYGDVFGAGDTITYEQCEIIRNRLLNGLSIREKYLLLNICGKCPIPMTAMLNSANSIDLTEHELKFNSHEIHNYLSSPDSAKKLESTMDLIGNMDYEQLQNENYKNKLIETFRTQCYEDTYNPTQINDNYSSTTIADIIDFAIKNHIKRESIFVFCPSNCYDMTFDFPGAYNRTFGVGYEYFCYTAADEGALPDGVEPGVWYKRKAEVNYYDYTSPASKYKVIKIDYDEIETNVFKYEIEGESIAISGISDSRVYNELIVPSDIDGSKVKKVNGMTFWNVAANEIEFTDGIEEISPYAIIRSPALKRIIIPASCKTIGGSYMPVVEYCDNLETIEIYGEYETLPLIVADCPKLKNIIFHGDVTNIAQNIYTYNEFKYNFYKCEPRLKGVEPRVFTEPLDVTIHGKKGSNIEKFAIENGFDFIAINEVQTGKVDISEYTESGSYHVEKIIPTEYGTVLYFWPVGTPHGGKNPNLILMKEDGSKIRLSESVAREDLWHNPEHENIVLSEDGKTLTFTVSFAERSEGSIADGEKTLLHEAGTYYYKADLEAGTCIETKFEPLYQSKQ